jgi:glutathione S-transferase
LTWALHKPGSNTQKIEATKAKLHGGLRLLEHRLESSAYVWGDGLTLADLGSSAAILNLLFIQTLDDLGAYPNVARWYARLQERSAWAAVASEQKSLPMPAVLQSSVRRD